MAAKSKTSLPLLFFFSVVALTGMLKTTVGNDELNIGLLIAGVFFCIYVFEVVILIMTRIIKKTTAITEVEHADPENNNSASPENSAGESTTIQSPRKVRSNIKK